MSGDATSMTGWPRRGVMTRGQGCTSLASGPLVLDGGVREGQVDPSKIEIRLPLRVVVDPTDGKLVAVPPLVFLGEDGRADLLRFSKEVTETWPPSKARKATPWLFTPESMEMGEGAARVDAAELARDIHRSVAPPRFYDEMERRRRIPVRASGPVLRRWWRKRLAQNRHLELATELREARRGYQRLRSAFGAFVRRDGEFCPQLQEHTRHTGKGIPADSSADEEWRRLERSLLRLVSFDRWYLTLPLATFAMRFASCTDYGGRFFRLVGSCLADKGKRSRVDNFNAERWELCQRGWFFYYEQIRVDWPYRKFRGFLVKMIVNYERLKCGRKAPTPESVRKWLSRNGW